MPRTKRARKVIPKVEYVDENEQKLKKNKSAVQYFACLEQWTLAYSKILENRNDALTATDSRYNVLRTKIVPCHGNMRPRSPVRHSPVPVPMVVPDILNETGDDLHVLQNQLQALKQNTKHGKRVTRSRSSSRQEDEDQPMKLPSSSAMARFRTPNCHLATGGQHYNVITPKVMPNVPLSIKRRPQENELAFALSGSPLMVSNSGTTDTPNVIIPLMDGRVMSILPQSGLRKSEIPAVDDTTMRQLMRLRDNLNVFLK